jgi:salicylate hydroxylase
MTKLRIGIVGAGLGGLCLAQGLLRKGIHADIYEADSSPLVRGQGYRLRIDSDGQSALATCLTPANNRLFRHTCALAKGDDRFVDPQFQLLDTRKPTSWQPTTQVKQSEGDLSANRQTLRDILSDGLTESIHWRKPVRGYRETSAGIDLIFADESTHHVDLLVAADGVSSSIRRQFLPHAEPEDIGAINVYGKTPLTPAVRNQLGDQLLQGTTVIFADGLSLIIEPMVFEASMPSLAAEHSPDCLLSPVDSYLYWAFFGLNEHLGGPLNRGELSTTLLQERIRQATLGWHPHLLTMLEHGDSQTLSARPVLMARSVPEWTSGRITLLGDAIHALSPAGGLGANTALRDASRLAEHLTNVTRPEDMAAAVHAYEIDMRERAHRAIRLSREGTERLCQRAVSAKA